MNKLVDQFIGLDPILGNEAKDELIKQGENSLDLVISRFGSLDRTLSLEIRLGELFGHFGNAPLDKLMNVLEIGEWHKMVDASCCFRNLPQEPAASRLVNLLSNNGNIDIQRCTIDALGYLGAKDWSFILLDLFPFDRSGLNPPNEGYKWQKLSYNVFIALLRMSIKEEEEGNVFAYYRLPDIERFYRIAGDVEYRNLISRGAWYDMLVIFTYFKSSAADAIVQKWLNNDNSVLQKMALKSLKPMRLNRIEAVLRSYLERCKEDDEIKSFVAEVLSDLPSKKAAETVKYIYSITKETSSHYKSICLNLAICLDRLDDKSFVEQTYPHLLRMGGEIAAHTYYNLGLLGYEENIWSEAIYSEDFIIRAAVSPIYAYSKGTMGIQRLLQMERESSHDIEQLLILSSLIKAGSIEKKNDLRRKLSAVQNTVNFRTFRYTWKREIILALKAVEENNVLSVWENLFGINAQLASEELSSFLIQDKVTNNQHMQQAASSETIKSERPMNIFISYSHKDEKWKDKLKSHLSALRNQGFLMDWDDRQIGAGIWDSQIENAMDKTDIFLLLITHNFISSSYITSKEITKAYSQFKAGKSKIFPIICDSCFWQLQPITKTEKQWHPTENKEMYVWLGKFQPFPKDGKPIKNWNNQQDAFLDIINQLKKLL